MGKLFDSLGDAVDFENKMLGRGVTPEMVKRAKSSKPILENIALAFKDGAMPGIIDKWVDEKTIRLRPLMINYDQTVEQMIAMEGFRKIVSISDFPVYKGRKTGKEEIELFLYSPVPTDKLYIITKVEEIITGLGFEPTDLPELSSLKYHNNELSTVGVDYITALGEGSRGSLLRDQVAPVLCLGEHPGFGLSNLVYNVWRPGKDWCIVRRK